MKISPIVLALASAQNNLGIGPRDSVQKLENEKRKHPQNKLHQLNKLLNRYTIMLKGFPVSNGSMDSIINSEEGQNRNLDVALTRNNVWCTRMLNTFYRTKKSDGSPVECSKYFHPSDDDSRRRRSAGWDLETDADTFAYQCEMIQNDFDAGKEIGEESGKCTDCCEKDENGNYIQGVGVRGKLLDAPDNMAKAMRRVMGAAKKWGQRWIKECGGQQNILAGERTPHYNVLKRLLKSGMKHDESLEGKIKELKWKRVFPASTVNEETGKKEHHKHEDFFAWLGIEA